MVRTSADNQQDAILLELKDMLHQESTLKNKIRDALNRERTRQRTVVDLVLQPLVLFCFVLLCFVFMFKSYLAL